MTSFSGSRQRSSLYLALLGIVAAVLAGFAVAYVDVGPMGLSRILLLPLGALLLVPFFIALSRRRALNFLEPIFVVVFGYGLFLFVRPLYILTFNDFEFMNFIGGSKEAVPLAIAFSIVGLAALYLGYYSPVGPTIASKLPAKRGEISPQRLRNWGFFVLALGSLLYGTFLVGPAAGSTASTSLTGSAYFYLGIDVAAVGVLLLFYWMMLRPRWRRVFLLALLLTILFVAVTYLGKRYHIVYLGLAVIASFYLLREKHFSFRSLLVFLPPAFLYVSGVGLLRNLEGGMAFGKVAEFDPIAASQRFFASGGDLNIFDTFTKIVTAVPESSPFVMPGRTFLYLFVAFVPRPIWPGKPLPTELVVNREVIGDIGAVAANTGYSYSLPGSFYIEGGIVTILIGMFIFGIFCRTVWAYYRMHGHLLAKAVLAVSLPYILLSQRGGFTDNNTIWYLTYLVPIIVGFYYASRISKRRRRERP